MDWIQCATVIHSNILLVPLFTYLLSIIASTVIIIAGNESMPVTNFVVTKAAMYASFLDLTIEYDTANVTDGGIAEIDATVTGTFTIVGDRDAIIATGATISKETKFLFTYKNEKITKLVIRAWILSPSMRRLLSPIKKQSSFSDIKSKQAEFYVEEEEG